MNENDQSYALATTSLLVLLATHFLLKRNRRKPRRWKTRPIYQNRRETGFYRATFLDMKERDSEQFFSYTRMTVPQFNYLVSLLSSNLKRRRISDQICVEEKVALTLQYLSQGVSMKSLTWNYKMGLTTVQKIIHEVCIVIWDVLAPIYLNEPTTADWIKIAKDFFELWNFPNCIGAIDGKHIIIQAPANSGSQFFNYKKQFSIVLLACCDAQYIFKLVDIGAYGSQSDGGVFRESIFGKRFEDRTMNVPRDAIIQNTNIKTPFVIVADEAFPLKSYIMRPYPGKNLEIQKRIFNYRLSRTRRVIENAFGILVARWRILKQNIVADVKNVDNIVKAVVVLHNFCKTQNHNLYCPRGYVDSEDGEDGHWRVDIDEPLRSVGRLSTNTASRFCYELRDTFCRYFSSAIGSLPWQRERVLQGTTPQT